MVMANPVPDKLLRNLGRAQIFAPDDPLLRASIERGTITPTEIRVVQWISVGLGDQDIADEMGRSVWTVKSQVCSVMRKLRAKNRGHAACIALREGIIN